MSSKYVQIADQVRRDIENGRYPERLPSERQLAKTFGATPVTVRKALDVLAAEGRLRKQPPLGTFVRRVERTRIRISLLPGFFGEKPFAALLDSLRSAFPAVDLEVRQVVGDSARSSDYDLLRSAHLAPVRYADFALPYPVDLVRRFSSEQYFQAAFDLHRINGHTYGMPLLFSPVVLAGERGALQEAGVSLDPHALDFEALLGLLQFARRKGFFLWNSYLARAVLRALVYSAADGTAETVAWERLHPLLRRFEPFCQPDVVRQDSEPAQRRPVLLHFCCRQAVHLFDAERLVLYAMPREVRARTPVASESLLLNSRCPEPQLAAEVAAHFLSPEVQRILGKSRMGVPVLKSAAMDSLAARPYRDDLFFTELRNVFPGTAPDHDFLQRLYLFMDEVIDGRAGYDDLVRSLEHEINVLCKGAAARERRAGEDYGLTAPLVFFGAGALPQGVAARGK